MIDLNSNTWQATHYKGIFVNILRRDEQSGDATVLIRMQPGCSYPTHRHGGIEEVFILQGGYRDARGQVRAGEYVINEAGSAHTPIALEGEDCVMLAIAHGGIELR
ncbi:MAG TPA: cupin domain-containing protein [Pyrinomonadaceae bacterium]|nr:cupin domain-containing protein [Pyrinomonadaceae bacterium]